MDTVSHTPGPWFVDPEHPESVIDAMPVGDDDMGALMIADCAQTDNAHANARLIAAAPDLLAALFAILDVEGEIRPTGIVRDLFVEAREAIAKASGSEVTG